MHCAISVSIFYWNNLSWARSKRLSLLIRDNFHSECIVHENTHKLRRPCQCEFYPIINSCETDILSGCMHDAKVGYLWNEFQCSRVVQYRSLWFDMCSHILVTCSLCRKHCSGKQCVHITPHNVILDWISCTHIGCGIVSLVKVFILRTIEHGMFYFNSILSVGVTRKGWEVDLLILFW